MSVLLVAPPWFSVPTAGSGGIEAVVALLADGLAAAGHEVELVASGGSSTKGRLRAVYDRPPSALLGDVAVELHHVLDAYLDPNGAQIIHDHSGKWVPRRARWPATCRWCTRCTARGPMRTAVWAVPATRRGPRTRSRWPAGWVAGWEWRSRSTSPPSTPTSGR